MKSVAECRVIIEDITQKIEAVEDSISQKKAEIEKLKRSNAKLVEMNIGKAHQPKSLSTQRKLIFDKRQQIEVLEFAEKSLRERLEGAEQELRYTEIYDAVVGYRESEKIFLDRVRDINETILNIATAIESFGEKVDQLKTTGHPLQILLPILNQLKGKVDVREFINNGRIAPPNGRDNDFIDEFHGLYKNLGNDIPAVGDLNGVGHEYISQILFISTMASNLRSLNRI
jgi:hypothetical protein